MPLLRDIYGRLAGLEGVSSLNAICTEFRQLANLHCFCFYPCLYFQSFTVGTGIALQGGSLVIESGPMLKIQRATNKQVVLTLSGRMDAENVGELKGLIESEARGRRVVLELSDLTLVDRDAVKFLERCETDSIKLENCPAYIREWIAREREGK